MVFGETRVFSDTDEIELGPEVIAAFETQDAMERLQKIVESVGDVAIRAA